jgi:hypothetical protein
VNEDWEAVSGLVNDVMTVGIGTHVDRLRECFKDELSLLEVVESLLQLEMGAEPKLMKKAKHRAESYMVEDGKLYRLKGGSSIRAKHRVECVSKTEAIELARKEHKCGGHWHRDGVKITLLENFFSPGLDQSIVKAISECARSVKDLVRLIFTLYLILLLDVVLLNF